MKFVADRMLGRLARWLRMLGYDTLYPDTVDDIQLVRLARAENRVLLTRDTALSKRNNVKVLLIKSTAVEQQLLQVCSEFILPLAFLPVSRCSVCNGPLEEIERRRVKDKIPDHVYFSHDHFWYCCSCRKHYWPGTHWQNLERTLSKIHKL